MRLVGHDVPGIQPESCAGSTAGSGNKRQAAESRARSRTARRAPASVPLGPMCRHCGKPTNANVTGIITVYVCDDCITKEHDA